MDYKITYNNWICNPLLSAEGYEELSGIKENDEEIKYRFSKELEFGTAGMRGIIGYGTNMMNVYAVKRATKGLAEYIKSLGYKAMENGVVISYDTRKNSSLFARACAGVLIKNGVQVRLFKEPSPVPMLSYAIRYYGAVAGIMITASHNPKEYNGYKVYGQDGAQMSTDATQKVVEYISQIEDWFSIESTPINAFKSQKYLSIIGNSFLKKYVKTVAKLSLSKKAVKKQGKKIKVVYTPLHGTGYAPVVSVLKKLGISCTLVENQIEKDPSFSTVEVPNPENKEALNLGIELANKINANLVFGTDPDCDRLGVAIRDDSGNFICLTGNQTGVLLSDYVLKRLQEEKKLKSNGVVVKSFVSTDMAKLVCNDYGVEIMDVPVGFKYIGEKIAGFEKTKSNTFLFGFEESCGYLRGTHSRDKDAVVASMLFAEMACYYEFLGVSIYSVLCDLYEKYGYVLDKTFSIAYSGANAMDKMEKAVEKLRSVNLEDIGSYKVIATRDYLSGVRTLNNGYKTALEYKNVNCVYYELEVGGFVCVRPSGTEPKLKIYYSVKGKDKNLAQKALEVLSKNFNEMVE
ncbi:MAG: phospho-sugar mutase [Clostridia bacterium]|nr:phospho-sugar mutase [Clostridia bacterium]